MWSVSLALVCRILLAVVLAGSGIGKLQDLDDSRQMMVDFGLPYDVARPTGTFLPGIELAVAVALLVHSTSWWAAWAALALLWSFFLAFGLNIAAGCRPDFICFDSLHVATIGCRVLSRNLALMAL